MPKRQIKTSKWQDYRGRGAGVLVYLNTCTKTHLPVRDVINEYKKGFRLDPNYETGTYNFLECSNSKLGTSAYNHRRSHFLFGTSYQGTSEDHKGKYVIIGYMKIQKVLEIRKIHTRKWMEQGKEAEAPLCVDLPECFGFYSEDLNFYDPCDCFELTEKIMKKWGYKGRVARHMKLTISEENTRMILDHFASKPSKTDEYIQVAEEMSSRKEEFLVEQQRVKEDDEEW